MDDPRVTSLVAWLRSRHDCVCEAGLTERELRRAERRLGVSFPPLWRAVLGEVHPRDAESPPDRHRSPDYPDWRRRSTLLLEDRIEAPVDGLLFDVEQNAFWWHAWGSPPDDVADRVELARERLRAVPRLVPILSHWYVAPYDDSPVFSIVQADLYIPAVTIADLATGRSQKDVDVADWPIGTVPFWSDLHAWSQVGHFDERFAGLGTGGL